MTIGFVYLEMMKIAIILAIAIGLTTTLGSGESSKSKSKSSSGVKVQPIKVKRKYDGPDSIYPKKMRINMSPAKSGMSVKSSNALGGLGAILAPAIKAAKNEKGED